MSRQIPLDLERPDRFDRSRFVTDAALDTLLKAVLHPESWLSPALIVLGKPGSGKTHLGHMFAAATGGAFAGQRDDAPALVIDDAETAPQEALFHLINKVHASGQALLLLTKTHPRAWDIAVPDLASRLIAMRLVELPEPGEALLATILRNLFHQRAISPSEETMDYLAKRMERSVGAAQKIVAELEYYANGRAFNRALVRDFFEQSETLFDDPDL